MPLRLSNTSLAPCLRRPWRSVPEYSSMMRGSLPSPTSCAMNSPMRQSATTRSISLSLSLRVGISAVRRQQGTKGKLGWGSVAAYARFAIGSAGKPKNRTTRSAARTFQTLFEHRDREHCAARPDERVEVELDACLAVSDGLRAFASTPGATGGDAHSGVAGFLERLDH